LVRLTPVCDSGLKGRFQGVGCFRAPTRRSLPLTHVALLKPALQAWGDLEVSRPGAYAPGSAEIGPSGLVRASGARCRFRGVVWASGPRFVGWACPRLRFRPEGPFSVSPGRSPGWQGPQKSWFLGLKGRFQGVCCFRLRARGFQTLTRLALPKPVLQACGRGGHVRRRDRMFGLCSASVCDRGLKRRFPVASGAAIVMPPFAGVMVQKIVPPHRPPLGQRPYTT